ncbi:hypothetical protein H2200_001519 [Cladophialophora chaetospira]|uniref:DUF1746 domain-containing protein n=1 Tax=Cladophialophora chaetospira TaxID=386627 RepID=A0AA39CP55_9EURO|nr:hypothetical protein H2200_001519 [Cladophialophora chaetospira]
MPAVDNDNAFPFSLTQERKLELPEKKDFLDPLLHALDAVIYLYFAALYICDQLSLLLILRLSNQLIHVRNPSVQLPPTILVTVVCIATHLLISREVSKRNYGGILIDFVGELAPTTSRLLILDLTTFLLQLVMLVVGHEKQLASGAPATEEEAETQDLDSEEAGRLRARPEEEAVESDEGIEMQSLLPNGAAEEGSAHQKRSDPGGQDDDMIILDMKKGLKTLMRRPPSTASSTATETPTALATFLTRVSAARARAAGA